MIDDRAARVASNEVRFRNINETLAAGLRRLPEERDALPFVCECGHRSCSETVSLSLAEYDSVRADGRHFLAIPGHEIRDVERVVANRGERYVVVEKFEETAPIVEATDPRSSQSL